MMKFAFAVYAAAVAATIFTAATTKNWQATPHPAKTHYFSPQGWTDVRKAVVT